jgi:starch phosphorylase
MTGIPLRTFAVAPRLPEALQPLRELAYNLWWTWNPDAVQLFRRIDERVFEEVEHSAVKLLGVIDQRRFEELAHDEGFMAHLERVVHAFHEYLRAPTWYEETYKRRLAASQAPVTDGQASSRDSDPAHPSTPDDSNRPVPAQADIYARHADFGKAEFRIAYFSMEFGLHESLPVYSGGLGVLAGDHLKSASDLGLPLVGVGLMYRMGYFRQYLNVDGWQQEMYPENDFFNLPVIPELDKQGRPILVSIPFPDREVYARIWRIQVGRVSLYLLDTNVPQNSPADREITGYLYGGDQDMRIRQEMVLGIGGLRALYALGIPPSVCHMNEGHSAFLALERIHLAMEKYGLSFEEAREWVTAGNVFTTHTPVPAGIDLFPPGLVEHYLSAYLGRLKIDRQQLLALGRQNPHDPNEPFSMAILALKLAHISNGVSQLHGKVARRMWHGLWPQLPENEVPIISITNGVHTPTWVSRDMNLLFERYLGLDWRNRLADHSIWKRVENIPDAELWRTHERRRERLVIVARQRLKWQLRRRGAPPGEIARADEVLDPEALTIGFARRFATYKRATLILRNLERLEKILNNKDRPVQIIFAGKAHPRDHGGKELIAQIVHVARRPEFRRRIVFLEDYDYSLARTLVQGVDVWLNNPRRPLEASGTSGMKVAVNGGLNLSILDGWWCEGYQTDNGWAIGAGEEYTDLNYQDEVESRAIYDLLEQEIVPLFYNRGSDGLPRGWIRMMKRSMQTITPVFNTHRMLQEYMERCYWPAWLHYAELGGENLEPARQLARWRRRILENWSAIRVENVEADHLENIAVGQEIEVQALVHLGPLSPDDVEVQLYHGRVDSLGEIPAPQTVSMAHSGSKGDGRHLYVGYLLCQTSGQHGFAVRVLPKPKNPINPLSFGLVTWG